MILSVVFADGPYSALIRRAQPGDFGGVVAALGRHGRQSGTCVEELWEWLRALVALVVVGVEGVVTARVASAFIPTVGIRRASRRLWVLLFDAPADGPYAAFISRTKSGDFGGAAVALGCQWCQSATCTETIRSGGWRWWLYLSLAL